MSAPATLREWIAAHDVADVECIVPDLTGEPIGKLVTAEEFLRGGARLAELALCHTVNGELPDDEDPDATSVEEIDTHLHAVAESIRIVPWARRNTAQIIHDVTTAHGADVQICARNVLKRVVRLLEAAGLQALVGPECEFYLVAPHPDAEADIRPAVGRSARAEIPGKAYSLVVLQDFAEFIDDLHQCCEQQHLSVTGIAPEGGPAQFEVNFRHGEPLRLADEIFFFKRTARQVALRHGMLATFMAKPMIGVPGSALHIHQSLRLVCGDRVFASQDLAPNESMRNYLGGLQAYAAAMMLMYAPNVNSYRRFLNHHSAPVDTAWAYDNRTVAFRVPLCDAENWRVENRLIGADANPYLSIAASLASGYLGMLHKLDPGAAVGGNVRAPSLPRTLDDSISRFRACTELRPLLGDAFVRTYSAVKEKEHQLSGREITRWERQHLLLSV